jgi:hypothetical protein
MINKTKNGSGVKAKEAALTPVPCPMQSRYKFSIRLQVRTFRCPPCQTEIISKSAGGTEGRLLAKAESATFPNHRVIIFSDSAMPDRDYSLAPFHPYHILLDK